MLAVFFRRKLDLRALGLERDLKFEKRVSDRGTAPVATHPVPSSSLCRPREPIECAQHQRQDHHQRESKCRDGSEVGHSRIIPGLQSPRGPRRGQAAAHARPRFELANWFEPGDLAVAASAGILLKAMRFALSWLAAVLGLCGHASESGPGSASAAPVRAAAPVPVLEDVPARHRLPSDESKAAPDVASTPSNERALPSVPSTEADAVQPAPPGCPRVEVLERPRWIRYPVAPRETIEQIAYRHGVDPTDLRAWNELEATATEVGSRTRLKIRSPRRVPPRREISYIVRPEDTWWRIAVRHGVDPSDLRAYNWPYAGKIAPGSELGIWIDPLLFEWLEQEPPDFSSSQTIRAGAVGIGRPSDGVLLNGVMIPRGDGYRLRFPKSAHGTTHAVRELVAALETYVANTANPRPLQIGAMSRHRGGPLGNHRSHQTGRDVDINLPRRVGVGAWRPLTPRRVDWAATWVLVRALADQDVSAIFLDYPLQKRLRAAALAAGASEEELRLVQYPRGRTSPGLVRHFDGHTEHMHVRFGCGPCEVECVASGVDEDAP